MKSVYKILPKGGITLVSSRCWVQTIYCTFSLIRKKGNDVEYLLAGRIFFNRASLKLYPKLFSAIWIKS